MILFPLYRIANNLMLSSYQFYYHTSVWFEHKICKFQNLPGNLYTDTRKYLVIYTRSKWVQLNLCRNAYKLNKKKTPIQLNALFAQNVSKPTQFVRCRHLHLINRPWQFCTCVHLIHRYYPYHYCPPVFAIISFSFHFHLKFRRIYSEGFTSEQSNSQSFTQSAAVKYVMRWCHRII